MSLQHAPSNENILLREDRAGVVTLTLNRPAQFNALSEEMLAGLQAALDDIAADESVRCVVLAGAGKAFCAGHDLKQMRANPRQDYYEALFAGCSRVMQAHDSLMSRVVDWRVWPASRWRRSSSPNGTAAAAPSKSSASSHTRARC